MFLIGQLKWDFVLIEWFKVMVYGDWLLYEQLQLVLWKIEIEVHIFLFGFSWWS